MKKILILAAITLAAATTFAQIPGAGMRDDVASFEQDDNVYQLFKYTENEGSLSYYLSVGRVTKLLEMVRDDIESASFDHIDEVCLYMGQTPNEVFASLDTLQAYFDKKPGFTVEYPCRNTYGAEALAEDTAATCVVTKRFLQGKRLCFHYNTGRRTAEVDLTKTAVKALRSEYQFHRKIFPKD